MGAGGVAGISGGDDSGAVAGVGGLDPGLIVGTSVGGLAVGVAEGGGDAVGWGGNGVAAGGGVTVEEGGVAELVGGIAVVVGGIVDAVGGDDIGPWAMEEEAMRPKKRVVMSMARERAISVYSYWSGAQEENWKRGMICGGSLRGKTTEVNDI